MGPEMQAPPTVMDRAAKMAHGVEVGDISRRQRGLSANGLDAVV